MSLTGRGNGFWLRFGSARFSSSCWSASCSPSIRSDSISRRRDITGERFGLLTALCVDHVHNGQEYWRCQCDCGCIHVARKSHLIGGVIRSCGCLYKGKKRGISRPPTYVFAPSYVRGVDFKGNSFFFDRDDFSLVVPFNWYLDNDGYVVARISGKNIKMHSYLTGFSLTDHANRNKADNRRCNLREASSSENAANCCPPDGKVVGVRWKDNNRKYAARINWNRQEIHLGMFREYKDAVRARLLAEAKYFGEFAPQKHLFQQYGIEVENNQQTASLSDGTQLHTQSNNSELRRDCDPASA